MTQHRLARVFRSFRYLLALGSLVPGASAGVQFGFHQVVAGQQSAGAVEAVAADLDRDGDLDVLVASTDDHGLGWYESQGGLRFHRSVPIGERVVGAAGVLARDLDGDGYEDVVVISNGDSTVAWHRNLGLGNFGARTLVTGAMAGPLDAEALDMDGDGDLDMVVGGDMGQVSWVENLGAGSFGPSLRPVGVAGALPGGTTVHGVDLNGDGAMDVVAGLRAGTGLYSFTNQGGGLSFSAAVSATEQGHGVRAIDSGDLDGDGDADVAVALRNNFGSPGLFQRLDNGAGVLGGGVTFLAEAYAGGVAVSDIDLDGDLDLVTSASDVAWHENLGAGTLAAPGLVNNVVVGGNVSVADLDQNGFPDVLWNSERGIGSVGWSSGLLGAFFTFEVLSDPNIEDPTGAAAIDFDLDGDLDLMCLSSGDQRLTAYRNLGNGEFGPQIQATDGLTGTGPIVAADMDADGDDDVVYSGGGRILWIGNRGNATFGPEVAVADGVLDCEGLSVGDIDGDGVLDVAWSSSASRLLAWSRGLGAGSFDTTPRPLPSDPSFTPRVVDAVDVDGDGDLDVLATLDTAFDGRVEWFENVGAGVFLGGQVVLGGPPVGFDGVREVRGVDVNEDSLPDVLALGDFGIRFALNLGGGQFGQKGLVTAGGAQLHQTFQIGDFNGDGRADVVDSVASSSGRFEIRVYYGNVIGPFQSSSSLVTDKALWPSSLFGADLDGDGDDDVVSTSVGDDTLGWCESIGIPLGGLGTSYCGPATPNSTGGPGSIRLAGSPVASVNALDVVAEDLPPFSFGYFIGSATPGFGPGPPGSQGNVCIGGSPARFGDSLGSSGSLGVMTYRVDLSSIPTFPVATAIAGGDTFHFQLWYRDANPGLTSNFTDAVLLTFE